MPQRLFRLQHDGEFGEVEAADIDQRAGARLGRMRVGMREGIADLAQRHQAERRRQVDAGSRQRWASVRLTASDLRTDPHLLHWYQL